MDKVVCINKEVHSSKESVWWSHLSQDNYHEKKLIITTSLNKQIQYSVLNDNTAVFHAVNKVEKSSRHKSEFQLSSIGSMYGDID